MDEQCRTPYLLRLICGHSSSSPRSSGLRPRRASSSNWMLLFAIEVVLPLLSGEPPPCSYSSHVEGFLELIEASRPGGNRVSLPSPRTVCRWSRLTSSLLVSSRRVWEEEKLVIRPLALRKYDGESGDERRKLDLVLGKARGGFAIHRGRIV